MNAWALRHQSVLAEVLEPGETLHAAERVVAVRRRRAPRSLPRSGFVLAVTDRRILIWRTSTWLSRPIEVVTDWNLHEGIALSVAPLRRVRVLLPDRTIVTLRPFGLRSIHHLAD